MTDMPRDSVLGFAVEMERRLAANDHKPGWAGDSPLALLARLREELDELEAAIPASQRETGPLREQRVRVTREAADVANFALMVAEVAGLPDFPMDRKHAVERLREAGSDA